MEVSEEDKNVIRECHWCKEKLHKKDIHIKSNARGYGYYATCPNCKNENVIEEVEC